MSIPKVVSQNGRKMLLVDDQPFILLSGEAHNSSSSSLSYMEPIWEKMRAHHLNSLLIAVSWQMIEPQEGTFQFDTVDGLIDQARTHGIRIGILWFGSWKNAGCSYAPDWVKADPRRFPRAEQAKGSPYFYADFRGFKMPNTTLSAFCEETARCDARAFAALCRHLKEYDKDHTVILIQVENETGLLGASRDHSDAADRVFAGDVPEELIRALEEHQDTLAPDLREAFLSRSGSTWAEVFGPAADEVFMAWHTAKHTETVAAAGKAEYPLPMYVNCWLVQGLQPGQYPSGGPVDRMMEVWQAAAPSIDWFAPDIYVPDFCGTCDAYTKMNNPLFIPETALHGGAAARLIYTVGHYHALGFAPFGIEDIGQLADTSLGAAVGMDTSDAALSSRLDGAAYGRINELLGQMIPLLTSRYGTSGLQAVIHERPEENQMRFGSVGISAVFSVPGQPAKPGACLVLEDEDHTFYLLGYQCMPRVQSLDPDHPYAEYLTIEEGEFIDGRWTPARILNGDEEFLRIGEPTILKFRVHLLG